MTSPDRPRPAQRVTQKIKDVLSSKLTRGAMAGSFLLSSCAGNGAVSPGSYVYEAINNTASVAGKTVEVSPVTEIDLKPANTTCSINGNKYVLDRLGGIPYIVIFISKKGEQMIFRRMPDKSTKFLPKALDLNVTYEEKVSLKNCPVLHPFMASVDNISS